MHEEDQTLTREEIDHAQTCLETFVDFYEDEHGRVHALQSSTLGWLTGSDILQQITHTLLSRTFKPDGSLAANIPRSHHRRPLFGITEVKAEIGHGKCDPIAQAEQCYKAFYTSTEAEVYRNASCSPCLLIGIVGPTPTPRPFIGPHFTTFLCENTPTVLVYTKRLDGHNSRKAVFAAQATIEGVERQLIVKYAHSYSVKGHKLLADNSLAPKLYFCEKVASVGMYVVVMDHISDAMDAADRPLSLLQRELLRKAVALLHEHDLVFGDLREPNIMVGKDGKRLMLIDFDWCGEEGKVRYPEDINMDESIAWHDSVGGGEEIRKKHDEHMLNRLVSLDGIEGGLEMHSICIL
ncbi:hypothetical protein BC628DRAFT_1328110 [Trametes gibbosa]|nr:hypothetical protein BC628DRAFT_1328110 [Trametes gibbosa]